jgi:hypothetical protein
VCPCSVVVGDIVGKVPSSPGINAICCSTVGCDVDKTIAAGGTVTIEAKIVIGVLDGELAGATVGNVLGDTDG